MLETSHISTINVLLPPAKSSEAPILVKILSTTLILALLAGTKEPIWHIKVIIATCLIYVDLPAILGPVIIRSWLSSLFIMVSLGINSPLGITFSTTGCLPFSILVSPSSLISGFIKSFSKATKAKLLIQSNSAIILAVVFSLSIWFSTSFLISRKISYSKEQSFSLAPKSFSSISLSSGVINLSALAKVCFLIYLPSGIEL